MKEPEKGRRVRKLLSIFSRSQRYRIFSQSHQKHKSPWFPKGLKVERVIGVELDDLMLGKHTL